jgi:hypothetical protein
MLCESLLCASVREPLSLDCSGSPKRYDSTEAVKYLRSRMPGVHYAILVSGVRTPLARSPLGAGILLRQHSKEVFPVNLDLRHYESAASLGTA